MNCQGFKSAGIGNRHAAGHIPPTGYSPGEETLGIEFTKRSLFDVGENIQNKIMVRGSFPHIIERGNVSVPVGRTV